ncbi:MAG TPA: hypothetical protein VMV36_01345, partial [Ignavibacteriaceae bacterium]|nr:hypothetical protein [Ignavibacteriaceae bacterium]
MESVTKYCVAGKQQLPGVWEYYFNGFQDYTGMELIPSLILTEKPQSLSIPSLKNIFSYNSLL